MSRNHGASVDRNGLVLHLDAANVKSYPGTGTSWYDMAGGSVGTLTNGPTFNSNNNGSILFDNVNDVVSIPHSSSHLVTSGTMIFWTKPLSDGTANVSRLANKADSTVGASGFNIAINSDLLLLRVNSGQLSSTSNLISYYNTWSMFTFTWTSVGNTGQIYINKTLDASGSLGATVSMTTTNPLYIGNLSDLTRTYDGYISAVMLYNRVLSAADIAKNYEAYRGRYGL